MRHQPVQVPRERLALEAIEILLGRAARKSELFFNAGLTLYRALTGFAIAGIACVAVLQVVSRLEPFEGALALGIVGIVAALFGVAHGLVYTVEGGPEYHALAAAITGALLVPAAWWCVGWTGGEATRRVAGVITAWGAQGGMVAAAGVILLTLREGDPGNLDSRWFVPSIFAVITGGYAVYLGGPRAKTTHAGKPRALWKPYRDGRTRTDATTNRYLDALRGIDAQVIREGMVPCVDRT